MLLTILFQAVPTIAWLMGDMLLILYIYSIVGLELFNSTYRIPYPRDLHDFMSFENWGDSLLLLFQMLSGSNWHELMLVAVLDYESMDNDAMMALSALYFVSFNFFASFVILSLILSVVIETVTIMSDLMKNVPIDGEDAASIEPSSHARSTPKMPIHVTPAKDNKSSAELPKTRSHKGLVRTLGLLSLNSERTTSESKPQRSYRVRNDGSQRRRNARKVEMKSSNIDESILEMEELKILSADAGIDLTKLKMKRLNKTPEARRMDL